MHQLLGVKKGPGLIWVQPEPTPWQALHAEPYKRQTSILAHSSLCMESKSLHLLPCA